MNKNKLSYVPIYETSDLYAASFIKASKIPLLGIRKEGNRIYFQFSSSKAEELAMSYFNDAKIPAATYARNFHELKSLIHGRVSS